MMIHFANKYIGLPWVAGRQGPDSFDCWGFVRWVLAHEYGHIVPPVNINPDNLRDVLRAFKEDLAFQAFKEVEKPQDGDVVLMRQSKNPVHAGPVVGCRRRWGLALCSGQRCGVSKRTFTQPEWLVFRQLLQSKTMIYFNYITNPCYPNKGRISRAIDGEQTIWDLVKSQKVDLSRPTVCLVNGVAVLRKNWESPLTLGSIVCFVALPLGGGGKGSNPLQVVLMVALVVATVWTYGAATAAWGSFWGGLAAARCIRSRRYSD